MKKFFILIIATASLSIAQISSATAIFINEIHYDNNGVDDGEAIEIAGPAGTDLTGWSLVLYNGASGDAYTTTVLNGIIPNQQNGFGTLAVFYPVNGIQNGSPDGLALADPLNNLIQFLSYEGSFAASSGVATGLTSSDIGVAESSADMVGNSLQLLGAGKNYEDFFWQSLATDTFGVINSQQQFSATVPEPGTLALLGLGLAGLCLTRRKNA